MKHIKQLWNQYPKPIMLYLGVVLCMSAILYVIAPNLSSKESWKEDLQMVRFRLWILWKMEYT